MEEINEGIILLNEHPVQLILEELPHLKKRMDDSKNTRDLDNISEMVNLADEKLMLNDLPSFVAVNLTKTLIWSFCRKRDSTTIRLRTFRLQTFRLLLYTSVQESYTPNFCFSKSLFSSIPLPLEL